jgi:hypothetical protein
MTTRSLIDKVQEEKPNTFSDAKLLSFINEIEYETAEQLAVDFEPYTEASGEVDLLVPEPYSRLYVSYVKSQVDYANEEYASYQLNAEQHVQDFRDFVDWVIRTGQAMEHTAPRKVKNIL